VAKRRPPDPVDEQGHTSDFDAAFRALCCRLKVPADADPIRRWVLVGIALAFNQPEFSSRRRGRPKDPPPSQPDEKALDEIETVMKNDAAGFDTVLNRVIQLRVEDGTLPHRERTAHPKRLRRAWAARQARRGDPPTLASFLRGCWGRWDKK
jgi:hypothetical protein